MSAEEEDAPPLRFLNLSHCTLSVTSPRLRSVLKPQRAPEMTTGCVQSTLEPEHRLMSQDSTHYPEVLDSRMDGKSNMEYDEEEAESFCVENQEEEQLKKPRRKDTPVLHAPPHVPGVRLLKAEKQMVHLEDEEND